MDSATSQYADTADAQMSGIVSERMAVQTSSKSGAQKSTAVSAEESPDAALPEDTSSRDTEDIGNSNVPSTTVNLNPISESGSLQVSNPPAPQYRAVEHGAEYKTVYHDAAYRNVTEYFTVCNDCGYKVQGSIYPHQDATGHGRYSPDVPVTTQVLTSDAWEEQVLVREAWTEWVLA